MKSILSLLSICLLAAALPATAQETAPTKKKKMAPLNVAKEPRTGKIYSTKPEKNRFTVRLDEAQWVVTSEKTNKVVAFHVAEGGKITIDGAEGKVEGRHSCRHQRQECRRSEFHLSRVWKFARRSVPVVGTVAYLIFQNSATV